MNLLKRLFGRADAAPAAEAPPDEPLLVNAYATVRDLPALAFPHEPNGRRDLSDPALQPHLDGFIGYVMGRGDGQMTALRYHLWRHLQRVRNHVSFAVAASDLPRVEAWALAANAVLFLPDGSVRAPDMALLMSAAGETDPAARLPYPPDAVARRARTLERLGNLDPKPPAGMPPALGEAELALRPPAEVLRRALALLYIAAWGQAFGAGTTLIAPGQRALNPTGFASLSPAERARIEAADPRDAAAASWRYEAANTLLWTLGASAARIADSDAAADVDALWRAVAPLAQDAGAADVARLRPPGEILEALDRAWREHWVVRQARQKGVAPAGLNGDVVAERHIALNWLTGFQNDRDTPWDAIDTPT